MIYLIKQEIFKLFRRKSSFLPIIFLIFIQYLISILNIKKLLHISNENIIQQMFAAYGWIVIFCIFIAGNIISLENQYDTFKTILTQEFSRAEVLISKYIIVFIYMAFLYLIAFFNTLLINIKYYKINLLNSDNNGVVIIFRILQGIIINAVSLIFILSVVILISLLFKNALISVIVGLMSYFMFSFVSGLLFTIIKRYNWIKWTPINALNLSNQFNMPNLKLMKYTQLSTSQLVIVTIFYTCIILFLTYYVFRNKDI